MRIYALYVVITFLALYAWKDWFKSLCGLILLMAIVEHPDMPKSVFGIQGLNPWNMVFAMVVLSWAMNRRSQGLQWDMPSHIRILLLAYVGVIFVGVLRAALDRGQFQSYPLRNLISEELINTIKWIVPAVLLFDGCRTRRRAVAAFACLLVMYLAFALQVIKLMPFEAALSDSGTMDEARAALSREIRYSASDLSVMLGGACWGFLAALPLIHKKHYRAMVLTGAGVVAFGQALTGGRIGYAAWGATGLVLCLLKWRKYLVLAPVVVAVLPVIFPGAAARMLEGFGQTDVMGQTMVDDAAVTSGRTRAWPYVIDEIARSPWIGYGRIAMNRTGLQHRIGVETGDFTFPHPHNMYLETLLDNGILGSAPIFLFWALVIIYSARLFRSRNHLYSAVGGLSLALTLTALLSGIGGQHFYPQEHSLGIWAAFFLSLRVYVENEQMQLAPAMITTPEVVWSTSS